MKRSITITEAPIEESEEVKARSLSDGMGAVITFSGVVRSGESGRQISAIDYEAYEAMAKRQFELIFDAMEQRWPVESIRLIHRIGRVPVKEASLWVEVVAPHRGEAFESCQWLIEEMKAKVPIWKRPIFIENAGE